MNDTYEKKEKAKKKLLYSENNNHQINKQYGYKVTEDLHERDMHRDGPQRPAEKRNSH